MTRHNLPLGVWSEPEIVVNNAMDLEPVLLAASSLIYQVTDGFVLVQRFTSELKSSFSEKSPGVLA